MAKEAKAEFKVLVVGVPYGGTIDMERKMQDKAAALLTFELNRFPGAEVVAVSCHDADHDFQLIAVIKVPVAEVPAVEGK